MNMSFRILTVAAVPATILFWTFGTNRVQAGNPTISLVASGLNFSPLANGPTRELSVLPGDRFTAEVSIRDWSPKGEQLIAYQAMIETAGFSSGPKGFIEPVVYAQAQLKELDNSPNVFVDKDRPDYIYKDQHSVPIVDSRSEGYRWMAVMLNGEGPVCPQDGKKYYGGSMHLMVSDNAAGSFTLFFKEGEDFSTLLKPPGPKIDGIEYENLRVNVLQPTDAGFWPAMLDRLNSHWFKTAQPEGHVLQDIRTTPRLASMISKLNESRRSVEKSLEKTQDSPAEKKE